MGLPSLSFVILTKNGVPLSSSQTGSGVGAIDTEGGTDNDGAEEGAIYKIGAVVLMTGAIVGAPVGCRVGKSVVGAAVG